MLIATIILAAGSSTRLGGRPKQLLTYQNETLVRRIAGMALSLEVGPVIAVLGANEDQIRIELTDLPIHLTVNNEWSEGMAFSLRVGLNALPGASVNAFLVVLTDQPYVTADVLQQLLDTRQRTGKGIVACRYGEKDNLGVPALFDIRYKAHFLNLSGDTGARKFIEQHKNDCAEVSFPLANIDLDTWQDVENWRQSTERDA